jgi:hypothetical protein
MGLAISLVSSVPEKVWFCSVKGYKPWLEPDAKNTRLQEQGGHTIWCVVCVLQWECRWWCHVALCLVAMWCVRPCPRGC